MIPSFPNEVDLGIAKALLLDPAIAQAAGGDPFHILKMAPEIIGAARVAIVNRLASPAPAKTFLADDGTEKPCRP
jgi:hypothetical protein